MSVQLSPLELNELRMKGFSEKEISQAITEIEREELQDSYNSTQSRPQAYSQQSSFITKGDNNDIVRLQLELNDLLEKTDHLLKGDIVRFENGETRWDKNPNPDNNPLNDFGVNQFMKFLSMLNNRGKILSDYEEKEIALRTKEFGKALNNFIFMKYEELGMDNEEKRKEYEMLVLTMTDLVESAFKRALKGGERRSLREMINVNQSNALPQNYPMQSMIPPSRSILNPMRYIAGKYK